MSVEEIYLIDGQLYTFSSWCPGRLIGRYWMSHRDTGEPFFECYGGGIVWLKWAWCISPSSESELKERYEDSMKNEMLGVSISTENGDDRQRILDLIREHEGIRLDIGCGANKNPGFIGLDVRDEVGVDIVHDVNVHPWPLPDQCVLIAVASHLIEHIPPYNFGFINFMNEVWRIMKPGGEFAMVLPHGRSDGYLQDPTHCNPCNEATWAYFDPEHGGGVLYNIYKPKPWRIKYLVWDPSANIEVVLVKRDEV